MLINELVRISARALVWASCLFVLASACADGPIGMSTGEIKDWQITASSTYPSAWDPNCHEKYSRLYVENGRAWCAKHRSESEWLQIDLGVAAKVTSKSLEFYFGHIFLI
jgi:hypothetical protein